MLATRRKVIGMPLAIFLSSRSSRIANALIPKYENLASDMRSRRRCAPGQ
jgi:hypothetical protein